MKKLTIFAAILAVMLVVACAPQENAETTDEATTEEVAAVTYESLVEKYNEETLKANYVAIMAAMPAEEVAEAVADEAAMVEEGEEEVAEEVEETVDEMAALLEKIGMTAEEWEVLSAYAADNDWATVLAEEIAAKKAEMENGEMEAEEMEGN